MANLQRFYLKKDEHTYWTLPVESNTTAQDVCDSIANKLELKSGSITLLESKFDKNATWGKYVLVLFSFFLPLLPFLPSLFSVHSFPPLLLPNLLNFCRARNCRKWKDSCNSIKVEPKKVFSKICGSKTKNCHKREKEQHTGPCQFTQRSR